MVGRHLHIGDSGTDHLETTSELASQDVCIWPASRNIAKDAAQATRGGKETVPGPGPWFKLENNKTAEPRCRKKFRESVLLG